MAVKKFVNPEDFIMTDLPLIVLQAQDTDTIGWLIRWRTNSQYNHSMFMRTPKYFASQGLTFKEIRVKDYIKKNMRFKFWQVKNITPVQRCMINKLIDERLNKPWWARRYDFLGIIGQATGLRWIQSPFGMYCSEQVSEALIWIGLDVPKKASPEDLNNYFKKNPDIFECVGYSIFED